MEELRRILSNRRLCIGLVLIILSNAFLFTREQAAKNYGLDCTLPASTILVFDGSVPASGPIDAKAAYAHYLDWIDKVKPLPLTDAVSVLEQERSRLRDLLPGSDMESEYIAVNNLLARAEYLAGYGGWLEAIQKSKDNMLAFPIFNDPDSFSGRNIMKTAEEFEKLQWLLLTAVNSVRYTIIVAAGVLVAEYSLYTFLPVQSALNGLKYFNLFTYISLSDLYTNYLNIDLFGYPLGIRNVSQSALPPLCLLVAMICILIHCRRKPAAGKDLLGRAAYRINSVTDMGLRHLRLFRMELHKMLWFQKGIVIAALFVHLAVGLSIS